MNVEPNMINAWLLMFFFCASFKRMAPKTIANDLLLKRNEYSVYNRPVSEEIKGIIGPRAEI